MVARSSTDDRSWRARKVVPDFAHRTPKEIRNAISTTGKVDLGERYLLEAGMIAREVRAVGLKAVVEECSRSETTILSEHPEGLYAFLIEDEAEHEQTVAEMIAAGVPVVHIAED